MVLTCVPTVKKTQRTPITVPFILNIQYVHTCICNRHTHAGYSGFNINAMLIFKYFIKLVQGRFGSHGLKCLGLNKSRTQIDSGV